MVNTPRAYVDGRPADSAALIRFARSGYHHFTTMQVRNAAVRGLNLHLQRLASASQALFGVALDLPLLRAQMLAALGEHGDAGLRISIGARNYCARSMPAPAQLETLILVDPPAMPRTEPARLMSFRHSHPFPGFKHAGNFDLLHLRRQALEQGFDDALLLDADGAITEGPTFNIGFFQGDDALVWPEGELLAGTTRQLLHAAWLTEQGKSELKTVQLDALAQFDGAFCCHSGGIWPLTGIDQHNWPVHETGMQKLQTLWSQIPAEPIDPSA